MMGADANNAVSLDAFIPLLDLVPVQFCAVVV